MLSTIHAARRYGRLVANGLRPVRLAVDGEKWTFVKVVDESGKTIRGANARTSWCSIATACRNHWLQRVGLGASRRLHAGGGPTTPIANAPHLTKGARGDPRARSRFLKLLLLHSQRCLG